MLYRICIFTVLVSVLCYLPAQTGGQSDTTGTPSPLPPPSIASLQLEIASLKQQLSQSQVIYRHEMSMCTASLNASREFVKSATGVVAPTLLPVSPVSPVPLVPSVTVLPVPSPPTAASTQRKR